MVEVIDRRNNAAPPDDGWKELSEYQWFNEFSTDDVSDEIKQGLRDEIASINEDEQKDYANPHQISRKHTREEYDRFRQEAAARVLQKVEPEPGPIPEPEPLSAPEPIPAPMPTPEDLQQAKLREEEISRLVLNDDGTRKKEYDKSANGDREKNVEKRIDDWNIELNEKVKRGEITQEEAYKQQDERLEAAINEIDAIRNEEYERQRKEQIGGLASIFQQIINKNNPAPESAPKPQDSKPAPEPVPAPESAKAPEPAPAQAPEPAPVPKSAPMPEPLPKSAPIPPFSIEPLPPAEPAPKPAPINHDDEPDQDEPDQPTPEQVKQAEIAEIKRLLKENDKALKANEERILKHGPIPAFNVKYDQINSEELASYQAERDLDSETRHAGRIKKLWKNRLFRKQYLKKYADEYLTGKRTIWNWQGDGERLSVHEVADRYNSATQNIVDDILHNKSTTKNLDAIESVRENDGKTTGDMLHAMIEYSIAKSKLPEGESAENLERELVEKLHNLTRTLGDHESSSDYLEVANKIDKLRRLDMPLDRVIDGFAAQTVRLVSAREEYQRFNIYRILSRIDYDSGASLD